MSVEPHAVRWAIKYIQATHLYIYTKWHWTTDAQHTLCGHRIPENTLLMETHEERRVVDCFHCSYKAR